MADPLSVLGAAVGVTSLIIQITDECIKGFKFYHEAANLPEAYRFLRVRIQIEQQRFLNFGLEAGILYEDGVLCSALHVNRSLLIAVLAEIKILLENYAEKNGKYEKFVALDDVDWDDGEEPSTKLMDLLCLPPDEKTKERGQSTSRREGPLKYIRKFGSTLTKEGRNLRSIVVEPKRLVWAAVDKESFESVISKLGSLNSFLVALLDTSQLRRLQDTMNTSYLEILQLRNDVASLTTLVEALAPAADNQQNTSIGNIGSENNSLSEAITEETAAQEKRKKYLKQLVEIKIQFTKMDQSENKGTAATDSTKSVAAPLARQDFEFAKGSLESDTLKQRTYAVYQGRRVWIEWKDTPTGNGFSPDDKHVERRIGLLIDLLRFVKPDGFRVPPCLGYVKITDSDDAIRHGIVFEKPAADGERSDIVTLRDLLGQEPKPSLSMRVSCCAVLARCVHSFHTVNWLHKALRADNIIFFSSSGPPDLGAPFVSGFELSRPSIINEMTEKPRFNPFKDIYRHPDSQSSKTDGSYRKSYDVYSLGVLIMEIALWKRIEDIVGLEDLSKTRPSALQEMQSWLLGKSALPGKHPEAGPCLLRVASACGDTFCNVVERCLKANDVEEVDYLGDHETVATLRPERINEQDIVKKLEQIASVL